MHVAIDATPLLGQRTGVGAFVAGVLPELAARDDVDIAAYALSLRGGRDLPAELPAGVDSIPAPLPASALLRLWSCTDHPGLDRPLGRPDVVHGTNFVVPPTAGAAVVTVHDLTPVRFPDLATAATRRYPAVIRRAIRRGAFVHTPSRFVADEVGDHLGAAPERVRSIAHGLPPLPSPVSGRSPVDGPYVLALGTVEPRKNLVALVRAFDELAPSHPDLRLVVAGPDGWASQVVEEAIVRSPHTMRIDRIGYVPPEERTALLLGARVYAYPSVYEGFGLPPLEAMACGVPVVAAPAGALPEVLGDAALLTGPDGLADALARALDDESLRATLIERGRARVASLSWDRCAAELTDLYRAAAA